MKDITILNYPGSKRRLTDFIKSTIKDYIPDGATVFDIFAGTHVVGYSLKDNFRVVSNDVERFSFVIGKALIENNVRFCYTKLRKKFEKLYFVNLNKLKRIYLQELEESNYLNSGDIDSLIVLYNNFKTYGQDGFKDINTDAYDLFVKYYSTSYFGILQAMEIDSIRFAIESLKDTSDYYYLLTCLFYAMKESVFAKDGHMAQPLSFEKNKKTLLEKRNKSVIKLFNDKIKEIESDCFKLPMYMNKVICNSLDEVLLNDSIFEEVDLIYADPPYTDMQYSRYFHLLDTVVKYDYPKISTNKGVLTKGLYRDDRFQSPLSQQGKAKECIESLIKKCHTFKKKLIMSYAYPVDIENQQTNRYTMSIDELREMFVKYYGVNNTIIQSQDFSHCNNRKSERKKVYEYLIIGDIKSSYDKKIKSLTNKISGISGTNDNSIYKSHLYWSQKPYNICDKILESLASKNSIVCDPFMGSGVTLIESLKKEYDCRPIGIEINDYPIYLVDTLLQSKKIKDIKDAFYQIKEDLQYVKNEYKTVCPKCGKETFISKSQFDIIENKKSLKKIYYNCICSHKQLEKEPNNQDLFNFNKKHKIDALTNFKLLENSRLAVKENEYIFDIFTHRNLYVLNEIYKTIKNNSTSQVLMYALLGIVHLSKIVDIKSGSQWPLWTPKKGCIEKNVIELFEKSLQKTLASLKEVEHQIGEVKKVNSYKDLSKSTYLVIKKGTQNITQDDIPDNSVDLVITDPPYLGQVIYSEYMQLYNLFLNSKIDYDNEIIVTNNKSRQKTENLYFSELDSAFKQISRLLKPEHYLCMYFHDSSLKLWAKLISIMEKNGFEYIAQTHINKKKNTLKNIVSAKKSLNGDAILFFIKRRRLKTEDVDLDTKIDEIKSISKRIIQRNHNRATTAELYDLGLLEYSIKNNLLDQLAKKYADLTEFFKTFLTWNEKGYWTE